MRRRFTGTPAAGLRPLAAVLLFGGCTAVGPSFKRPEVPWLAGSPPFLGCGAEGDARQLWAEEQDEAVLPGLLDQRVLAGRRGLRDRRGHRALRERRG